MYLKNIYLPKMEEIYKQYLQYDFNNSDEYKEFKDKFPLDQNETIEDHHKRFYKSHICRDFDVNYKPPQSSNSTNHNSHSRNNNAQRNRIPNTNKPPLFEIIDFGILGLSFLILPISLNNYLFVLIIYFIYRLSFSVGIPAFNLEYLKSIIHQNYFSYLILSLILWVTGTKNLLFVVPLIINTGFYLIKGINKYIKSNLCDKIISFNALINDWSLYAEICNLISPIIGLFMGTNRFYFFFIYLQYIKFRYYASEEIRDKINAIRVQLEVTRTNSNNPMLRGLASIIQKIGNTVSQSFLGGNVVMVNGGIMACNIF